VADGAIVGSALVRLVAEQAAHGPAALTAAVERFVADLVAAAR
jgi:tryptophan synthase alpha subunit